VAGNLKYNALPAGEPRTPDTLARTLLGGDARRVLWVAGSTMAGEEEAVLCALHEVRARAGDVRLVLAPRKPERFDEAVAAAERQGFTVARRTTLGERPWSEGEVLVLDTIGELALVYPLAAVVFVGGSLVPTGGHNVLEPAAAGKAIVVGPHMENFQEIADEFRAEGALVQVGGAAELGPAVAGLLADDERRRDAGDRARALVQRNRGALEGTLAALSELLPPGAVQ
jgi:3-deoxy-D-manno-octulosonic-acid transferase